MSFNILAGGKLSLAVLTILPEERLWGDSVHKADKAGAALRRGGPLEPQQPAPSRLVSCLLGCWRRGSDPTLTEGTG